MTEVTEESIKSLIGVTPSINTKGIAEKREQLEILRIENEIKRLSKPDVPETNYFKEMMAQQSEHFKQLLEMNRQQNDLKLEIEKLKLIGQSEGGEDSTLAYLEMLKPFIPVIAENMKKKAAIPPLKQSIPQETKGGEKTMEIKTAADLEEYKKKIRAGEITEEQAYKDFKEQVPPIVAKKLGKKGFKIEFDKIKNELP